VKTAASTPVKKTRAGEKDERHWNDDEILAAKILSKQMLKDAKQIDHAHNEMSLTAQLDHPFIVSLVPVTLDGEGSGSN
jgi:hypothetical protein